MSKKSGGLGQGTGAFWQSGPRRADDPPEGEALAAPEEATSDKSKKLRTTVTLYPDTLAKMENLKVQARRAGVRATYSDILEEAINDLAHKRGVEGAESV